MLLVLTLAACGIDATGRLVANDDFSGEDGGGGADASIDRSSPTAASDGGDDVTIEADVDASSPADAATEADALLACPSTCTGGCGDAGNVCTVRITSFSSATINCPMGFACRVECTGSQVCGQTINCAAGTPCVLVCDGNEACKSGTLLNAGAASSACLVCNGGGGNTGCDQMTCNALACTRVCDGDGCGSSCTGCTTASSCP